MELTDETLAQIRDAIRPGNAIALASLIAAAQTDSPLAEGPVIQQGCVINSATALKEAVRLLWFDAVPALLADHDRLAGQLAEARKAAQAQVLASVLQEDYAAENLRNERSDAIQDAIDAVTERKMKDSVRFAGTDEDSGSCGPWCGHGETCHRSEAQFAHERTLADLRVLDPGAVDG